MTESTRPATAGSAPGSPMAKVLRGRNFRLLWLGQSTSLLGDQFAFIALPWLVLRLTNDPLALGFTLALGGIPRALVMLIGGAIADRFPARTVMLVSDIIRLFLVAVMSALVLTGGVQLWMVYLLSFAFGLVAGFFMPASGSMMPSDSSPSPSWLHSARRPSAWVSSPGPGWRLRCCS